VPTQIHPSAVVDPGARLGDDVRIGPFCHVGADVEIGRGSELVSHVSVLGPTRMGEHNRVFPHATLGAPPQDLSYHGEHTELVLGDHNELREGVTLHRGTKKGGGVTRVGSHCLLMVGTHVAHDCTLEDHVILTNQTSLGGHVHVESRAVTAGHVGIMPFVRLGNLSFVSAGSMVERHVPPFVIAAGDRARVRGINRVGLRRAGVPAPSVHALEHTFQRIYRGPQTILLALEQFPDDLLQDPYVARFVQGVRAASDQPLCRSRQ
jgi:UDP-N-acetylglucosamine acyltransferase